MTELHDQQRKFGLMVGLPLGRYDKDDVQCTRPVTSNWALSMACQGYPANVSIMIYPIAGKEVGEARNEIVRRALETDCRYVWFVDDDVQVPVFAIRKLIYEIEQRPEFLIIGGIYCTKEIPPAPVVFKKDKEGPSWDWKQNEIFEVESIGMGCTLIKIEAFRKIEPPWFVTKDDQIVGLGSNYVDRSTEDLTFCRKAREAGIRILADGSVLCTHWDAVAGKAYYFPDDCYPIKNKFTEEKRNG